MCRGVYDCSGGGAEGDALEMSTASGPTTPSLRLEPVARAVFCNVLRDENNSESLVPKNCYRFSFQHSSCVELEVEVLSAIDGNTATRATRKL